MPVRPDSPLRKVTINLYEADCAALEKLIGYGWSEEVRQVVHKYIQNISTYHSFRKTLGDLE